MPCNDLLKTLVPEDAAREQTLKQIDADQARMRANMERVPKESDGFERYPKKFDDQKTETERR